MQRFKCFSFIRPYITENYLLYEFDLVRDDALRIGIAIEFHSSGAIYEYDLSNKEERDLGTANAPLTDDRSVRLLVSTTGFR